MYKLYSKFTSQTISRKIIAPRINQIKLERWVIKRKAPKISLKKFICNCDSIPIFFLILGKINK